jgi:hypothetical protein
MSPEREVEPGVRVIRFSGIRRGGPDRVSYPSGVAASLVAEAVFIAMVMLVGWLRGKDPWTVARVPGAFLLGPDAVRPPGFVPGDVLIGLLMHLWLGILVGVVYAALLPRLRLSPMAGGLVAAAVLYAFGFWILPLLFPAWLSPFWLPPVGRALQAVAHVVYGVVFGWTFGTLAKRRA